MIKVEQGLVLSLQFTAFDVVSLFSACDAHHLEITDGDGTTLMEKSCGPTSDGNIVIGSVAMDKWISISSSLPPNITSTSNVVKLVFITRWVGSTAILIFTLY